MPSCPDDPDVLRRAIHDLHVHQVRLEAQNDELRRAYQALETGRTRYADLYDHAPVGYLTIDEQGAILEANLWFADMLGIVRSVVISQRLSRFIHPADQGIYDLKRQELFRSAVPQSCRVRMLRADGTPFWARVTGTPIAGPDGAPQCMAAVADITQQVEAGAAIEQSRDRLRALAASLQEVREAERTRIARDIHDVLAQDLTRLKIDLVWLHGRLSKSADPIAAGVLAARVSDMSRMADATIVDVQRIATDLRPAVLDSLGLCAAVEWQVREVQGRSGIACHADLPPEDLPLGRETATAAFRIVQESLTNIQRHAKAASVTVSLRLESDCLVVRIHDDGCGIQAEALTSPLSIGLMGMRERATLLGGHLDIVSQPGSGTTIEARMPLSSEPGHHQGGLA